MRWEVKMSAMLTKIIGIVLMTTMLALVGVPASQARFLTPDTYDPWEQGVGTNRYSYSGDDPINGSDPNGHASPGAGATPPTISPEDFAERQLNIANSNEWLSEKLDALAYYSSALDGIEIPASKTISPALKEFAAVLAFGAKFSRELPVITATFGKTFKTFNAFKNEYGSAGVGKVWHHIVEKCQSNCTRSNFPPEMLHNTKNIVSIPNEVNIALNKIYSSNFINGQTLRDWISTKPWKEQYAIGQKYLKQELAKYEKSKKK